ncbi:phage portal protein family protein [Hydrogenimonas thermophila]|uniref:Mu-like prophage protein gp29 n=1 Tax=Hydrogenimonas thermophila TaxID=223786 RepID=A0A1I5RQJ9_9BACT|nr:DUF935 family protein [Hydrogenimonas thermophila]SFP60834.1 Mu-like prophage protein gp29 [Hydrogenimonas thermophila]
MKNFNLPKLEVNRELSYLTIDQVKKALSQNDFDALNQLYYLFINRDLKIAEGVEKRKDKLLSLEWELKNHHPLIEKININDLIKSLQDSIYYGFSVVDIGWETDSGLLIPTEFKKLHPLSLRKWDNTVDEYYYFHEKNSLNEIRLESVKEKILFHNHTKSEHIHTEALAYKIAFYAILKHTAIVYNMQYFDSLAIPPIIVKSSSVDDEKSLNDLIAQLQNLKSNSFGIFNENIEIQTLLKQGTQTDFLSLINYFDNLISLYITGLGIAAEGSKAGSFALSQTSQNRLDEKVKADATILADTITEFLNRYLSYNVSNFQRVEFSFVFESETKVSSPNSGAGTSVPQNQNSGVETSVPQKPTKEKNAKSSTLKPKPLSYQERHLDLNPLTDVKDELNEVYKILKECNSYEEALSKIEKFDNPKMEQTLEQLIFSNHLLGVLE